MLRDGDGSRGDPGSPRTCRGLNPPAQPQARRRCCHIRPAPAAPPARQDLPGVTHGTTGTGGTCRACSANLPHPLQTPNSGWGTREDSRHRFPQFPWRDVVSIPLSLGIWELGKDSQTAQQHQNWGHPYLGLF